jgi:hypothetical protein
MTQLLCTLQQVRKMIGLGDPLTETGDDALIEDVLIPAATDMINNEVQFPFGTLYGSLELFAAPPYYVGGVLYFRDNVVTQIDSIASSSGTLTAGTDYVLMPLNFAPKTSAALINFSTLSINNPAGTLTLNGTLGYGSIPSDVNFAATKLAAWMYQTRDSSGEIQIVNDVTIVPSEAPAMVHKILSKYKHNLLYA